MRTPRTHVMTRDQLNDLLNAFATDTLTPEQRNQLNRAARRDERLLCALADPQALQEVLNDPALRGRLLSELQPEGAFRRAGNRWRKHPWLSTAAGGMMTAVALIIATQLSPQHGRDQSPGVGGDIRFIPLAATAIPGSDPTPLAGETRTSPPRRLNNDPPGVPVVKRKVVRLAESLEQEHVLDEDIKAAAVPQKSEHQMAAEKIREMASATRIDPREEHESVADALTTEQKGTMPATLAEPAEPPQAHPTSRATATALPARDRVSSRDSKYGPPSRHGSAALGVRYSLMIAGPHGTYREVDLETPVTVSDRPRLAVQTNQDGYLLVTEIPSTPKMSIASTVSPKPVRAGTTTIFPLGGSMRNPTAKPVRGVRVMFAHRRPDPKLLLTQVPRPPLQRRVEPASEGPTEHALYATAPADSATSILLVDVPLNPWPDRAWSN